MHIKKVRNHYEVLGVNGDATSDEIKQKYRELAKKFHPDQAADKEYAHTVFSQINQAYRVLADPEMRLGYDAELRGTDHMPRAATASHHGIHARHHAVAPKTTDNSAQILQLLHDADHAQVLGKNALAKAICSQILSIDPNNFRAFCILGDVLVQMNKPVKAAAAYKQALKISPSPLIKSKLDRLNAAHLPVSPPIFSSNTAGGDSTPEGRRAGAPNANSLLSRLFRR